jgi:hypothetical protein
VSRAAQQSKSKPLIFTENGDGVTRISAAVRRAEKWYGNSGHKM